MMRKFIPTSKWLALMVLVLAAGIFMGQRPKQKYPSPADSGMRMEVTGKTIAESPELDDPNAGDDPQDDSPDEIEAPIREEYPDIPKPPGANLAVKKVEVVRVGAGSDLGQQGDWALVISGHGFLDGEAQPIVHLGDAIHLKETMVGVDGMQLFAVLPTEVAADLPSREFETLAVQNPGGLNRDPSSWGILKFVKEDFLRELAAAKEVKFIRGDYFLEVKR